MKFKKKNAFTMIETIIYIFLSALVIAEGLNLLMPMYQKYLEIRKNSMRCNEYKEFYINLNNIISEGGIEQIVVDDDYITLCKGKFDDNLKKTIRVYDNKIVAVYSRNDETLTYNNMLFNIEKIQCKKNGRIIYIKIYDDNGEEFICSI